MIWLYSAALAFLIGMSFARRDSGRVRSQSYGTCAWVQLATSLAYERNGVHSTGGWRAELYLQHCRLCLKTWVFVPIPVRYFRSLSCFRHALPYIAHSFLPFHYVLLAWRFFNTLRTGAFKLFKCTFPGSKQFKSTFILCFFKNL